MDNLNAQRLTGDDLRLLRVAARLSMRQVSEFYGATPQRIAAIEAHARPTREACRRYHLAVKAAASAEGTPPNPWLHELARLMVAAQLDIPSGKPSTAPTTTTR